MNLFDLHKSLDDIFVQIPGPAQSYVSLGDVNYPYVTFAFMGEVDNSTLIKALWEEMKKSFPPPGKKQVLFWRRRPLIEEETVDLFGAMGPTREEVEDGAEIPPEYRYDFDSNRYREVIGQRLMRRITCRCWWPGVIGNKEEGQRIQEIA